MGRDTVLTYKRLSSSKADEPNSSATVTKEYEHDKKRQKLSSGCMKQQDSSCMESSTRLKSNSKLVAFCRRFVQNRNIPELHASADHVITSFHKLPGIDVHTRESFTDSGKKVDDQIKFLHTTAENSPLAAPQLTKDSVKEKSLLHGQEGAQASYNIDCNLPWECGSDNNNHTGTSKFHLSGGSSRKMKEKMSTIPKKNAEGAVRGKDKGLAGSSLLFAESRSNFNLPCLANEQGRSQLKSGVCLQPEQTMNSHTPHSWPNLQISPSTWSGEELDSFWIGVRRHGKGNWGAILRDPQLNFMPWRTPSDLAQRWEDEQFLLLYSGPISKRTYASRLGLSSERQTNLQNTIANSPNQPCLSSNRFTSLLRQVEMESAMKAQGTNPPLVIGRSDVGRRDEVIVILSDSSSEETTSDDLGVRH